MAMLSGALHTYRETVLREDILDEIQDVSPDQNYLTTTLGVEEVGQRYHQWPEFTLSRPTSNSGSIEGDDNSYTDRTVSTMRGNWTQIIKETFAVTETEIVVNKVSPKDAYARELGIAMRSLKNKMEYAVLRGTLASGNSGVARETNGFIPQAMAGGVYTLRASGTSLSENEFNDMVTASWTVTDEYVADLVLASGTAKRDISLFTAGTTKNIEADDKRLVRAISVYESDFGIHEIRAHKDMPSVAGGLTNSVLLMRKELAKIGYLRKPRHVVNSLTGDNKKGHVVTELLAVGRSVRPWVYRTGYNL